MALPTFIIIGAGKCGTTSLHYYLDLHPEIQMSAVKETHFFAGPANGHPYGHRRVETVDAYEQLFDPAAPVRGEASPSYANDPIRAGVPARIKELVPDAKLIYLVRDPIARTVSHYQHRVGVNGDRQSLRELLDSSEPLGEIDMSRYATQLENYLVHFSPEQIMVIDQVDLLGDRDRVLAEVFRFLAVDEDFSSPQFEAQLLVSSERRSYPAGYNRAVRRLAAPAAQRLPAPLRRRLRGGIERRIFKPLPAAQLEEDQRQRLRELYAPEVERLRALTGKSFPTWSL